MILASLLLPKSQSTDAARVIKLLYLNMLSWKLREHTFKWFEGEECTVSQSSLFQVPHLGLVQTKLPSKMDVPLRISALWIVKCWHEARGELFVPCQALFFSFFPLPQVYFTLVTQQFAHTSPLLAECGFCPSSPYIRSLVLRGVILGRDRTLERWGWQREAPVPLWVCCIKGLRFFSAALGIPGMRGWGCGCPLSSLAPPLSLWLPVVFVVLSLPNILTIICSKGPIRGWVGPIQSYTVDLQNC